MNKQTMLFLMDRCIDEYIISAMRGPDMPNPILKSRVTAPLRWAVGYMNGDNSFKSESLLEVLHNINVEFKNSSYAICSKNEHYMQHLSAAIDALAEVGYTFPNRLKLEAYLNPGKAKYEAMCLLGSAQSRVRYPMTRLVNGYSDDERVESSNLLQKLLNEVTQLDASDKIFNLQLEKRD